ncbi:sodium/glutamate symporter [uncultured Tateyamaria sp.]|uniref:sodium/glutamate symporter n=1 Tax=uncultured Tateyamaria sp. TaxID=455651 RepID=UPI00345092E4
MRCCLQAIHDGGRRSCAHLGDVWFCGLLCGCISDTQSIFLRRRQHPKPVSGGHVVAFLIWVLSALTAAQIAFHLEMRDCLFVAFFATLGLNAQTAALFHGGTASGADIGPHPDTSTAPTRQVYKPHETPVSSTHSPPIFCR